MAVRSSRRRSDTQKHDNRTIEPHEIGVLEGTDLNPKFGARHRSHFVDHESARFLQAVERGRFNVQAEQRGVGRVRGEGTDGDRVGIEAVVLDDHCRPRLPGVAGTACNGPDFSTPHSSGHEETESMNSWSSAAATLAATARDWRCASSANPGARTSGTQIWTGRRPCALSRARCSRTRFRELVLAIITSLLHVTIAGFWRLSLWHGRRFAPRASSPCPTTFAGPPIWRPATCWKRSSPPTASCCAPSRPYFNGGHTDRSGQLCQAIRATLQDGSTWSLASARSSSFGRQRDARARGSAAERMAVAFSR